jgi:ribose transport system substrate-binding protein
MAGIVIVVLVAGACTQAPGGSPTATAAGGSPTATTTGATGEKIRIGLVLPDLTNQTINDIYLGAQDYIKDKPNIELLEGGTSETQPWLNACDGFVAAQVDVLAYDSLDAEGTSSCIEDANAAGIKVICLLACTARGTQDATIALDFLADGKQIGVWLGEAVGGQTGNIAFLEGPAGDQAAQAIGDGFLEGLKEACAGCTVVAQVPGGHDRDTGFATATNVLTANPNLNGMYGLNDDIALGAFRALETAGKEAEVTLAGHNGTCETLGSIIKGELDFTMLLAGQPFGIATIDTAIALMNGETPGTINVTPIPIDTEIAKGILDGSTPEPAGVDVKARLEKAQAGC